MPPEILAFMQANGGRLPTSEIDLQAFLQSANLSNLQGGFPPGAGLGPPPSLPGPGDTVPSQFGPEFPSFQMPGPLFSPELDPQVIPPSVPTPSPFFSPDVGAQGGAPLPFPGGPGPVLSPPAGAPGGAPLPGPPGAAGVLGAPSVGLGGIGPPPPLPAPPPGFGADPSLGVAPGVGGPATPAGATTASEGQAREGGEGALGALAGVFGDIAGGVARARLGGGPQGFSFTQGPPSPPAAPSAGPLDLGGLGGGLPGVPRTGSGDVLTTLGAQQQADVAGQRQAAAQGLGGLLGGGGQAVGLLLDALGQLLEEEEPAGRPKRITIGGSTFDPTLRASALGSPAVTGRR